MYVKQVFDNDFEIKNRTSDHLGHIQKNIFGGAFTLKIAASGTLIPKKNFIKTERFILFLFKSPIICYFFGKSPNKRNDLKFCNDLYVCFFTSLIYLMDPATNFLSCSGSGSESIRQIMNIPLFVSHNNHNALPV